MKKLMLFFVFAFLWIGQLSAQPSNTGFISATEPDGAPDCYGYQLKFTNGAVTDNGDGSCSVAVGSSSTPGWTDDGTTVRLDTSTDNVGMGTTAPDITMENGFTLHTAEIFGTAVANFTIKGTRSDLTFMDTNAAANNKNYAIRADANLLDFLFANDDFSSYASWMTATRSANTLTGLQIQGNVGINKSPVAKLDITSSTDPDGINLNVAGGTARINFQNSGVVKYTLGNEGSSNSFQLGTTAVGTGTMMTWVGATGNIGIGSTVPNALLDITGGVVKIWTGVGTDNNATSAGELYVQGDLEVDGSIYGDGANITGIGAAGGWTDGGTNVYVTAKGDNVAVGTTILSTGKLTIAGNGTTTGINTQWQTSAGTAKITILDNGNIGFGTTLPAQVLDVAGAGTFTGALTASNLSGTNTGDQSLAAAGGWTDGGTNMTQTTIGDNVAIGTTTLSSGKLTVAGNGTTTGINTQWQDSSGSAKVTILDNGNVGIGTTVPEWPLRLTGNQASTYAVFVENLSSGTSARAEIDMQSNGANVGFACNGTGVTGNVGGQTASDTCFFRTGASAPPSRFEFGTGTSIPLHFFTNDTTRMTFLGGGNVGIGSTVPQALFVVQGTGTTTAKALQVQNSSAAVKFTIQDDGNVGIGTTIPVAALTVTGHVHSNGTAPTVANNDCGSTAQGAITAKSTDVAGFVTAGTLNVTSCAVTFNTTWTNAPVCVATDDTNILSIKPSSTTTKLTLTSTTSMSGDVISWICLGNE